MIITINISNNGIHKTARIDAEDIDLNGFKLLNKLIKTIEEFNKKEIDLA